jgi:hypothetical protein
MIAPIFYKQISFLRLTSWHLCWQTRLFDYFMFAYFGSFYAIIFAFLMLIR